LKRGCNGSLEVSHVFIANYAGQRLSKNLSGRLIEPSSQEHACNRQSSVMTRAVGWVVAGEQTTRGKRLNAPQQAWAFYYLYGRLSRCKPILN
jgi:hypothetical protein